MFQKLLGIIFVGIAKKENAEMAKNLSSKNFFCMGIIYFYYNTGVTDNLSGIGNCQNPFYGMRKIRRWLKINQLFLARTYMFSIKFVVMKKEILRWLKIIEFPEKTGNRHVRNLPSFLNKHVRNLPASKINALGLRLKMLFQ